MTSLPIDDNPYLQPPVRPTVNPWLIRVPILFLTGAVLLLLILVLLVGAFRFTYDGRVTPGVTALDANLSGMTRSEAVAALSDRFTYDESAVFTLWDGDVGWQITAGALGISFDAEATVDQALAVGKDADVTGSLVDQALAWLNGESVAPIIRYDQSVAVERLTEIAEQINQEPRDALLTIQGTEVSVQSGQMGRTLDIPATLARLDNAILALNNGGEISLVVEELPPRVWNAEEAAGQVRAALSGPLELVADGASGEQLGPWTASVDQIASLLTLKLVENGDGTRRYEASIDMSAFENYLNSLAPGLLVPPRDARFHFNETTRQLEVVQPAVYGRTLNVEETLAQLEQAVFRYDNRSVPMAFDYTAPRYADNVTAAELGITEMVAEATTIYTGSTANRRHNIAEGASRFDGVIIGPGEEFSFNYWLGDVSEESGFVESMVIVGERTVDGIGGGICQVSTTAFRAAFFAGFPIIERNSHAYRVGFYELNAGPGLDAAIWTPDRDMRFQNDTPYHLLIETSFFPANNTLQFRFYSTNPGRTVEIQDPIVKNVEPALEPLYEASSEVAPGQIRQVDWAAQGADVTVYRIVRDAQGNEIRKDHIYTHYFPWRAVYQVAPGDPRAGG